jgi:hypothetical protein
MACTPHDIELAKVKRRMRLIDWPLGLRARRRFGWPAALLAAALVFSALPAAAVENAPPRGHIQPRKIEEAREHFANGVKLFDEGKLPLARDEMEKAYAMAPSYKLLYNLGLVYRQLNDHARAVQTFENYLSQGAWEIPDARVAEVTRMLSELTPLVGSVRVTSKDPGVQIFVDDRFVGQTPIDEPIAVNPGEHSVTGKLVGKLPSTTPFSAAIGEIVPLQVDLKDTRVPTDYTYPGTLVLVAVAAVGAILFFLRRGRVEGGGGPANAPKSSSTD